jgi:ADP-heptose:LPS heptosyltransferase
LIELLKRTAFRGIAATERTVRVFGGASPSLDPADLRKIRNFLIPQVHPFLGAAVHETPLIESLRSAVPEANIVAVGSGIGAEVLRNHPGVARLEPAPDPNQDFWQAVRSYRRVVRSFRGEPWCALFTGWNGRSRVLLATMLAGSGVRAGFSVAPPLAHLSLAYDPGNSQIANNLLLPGLLGHAAPSDLEPRVYFTMEDLRAAHDLLALPEISQARPLVVFVTQTRVSQRKQWRQERFVTVARWLIREHGCRIALVGTESESLAVEALQTAIGEEAFSLAGRTSYFGSHSGARAGRYRSHAGYRHPPSHTRRPAAGLHHRSRLGASSRVVADGKSQLPYSQESRSGDPAGRLYHR